MDHKTFSAYTLKADAQQGIVESIVAVMGNDDQGGDIIHPGAFLKTITERRGKIRVLDQHQTDSIMRVIGKPVELKEIPREQLPPDLLARYPTATGGLYAKTQFLMDTPEGAGAFKRISSGAVDEYSIGYDPLDVDYSKMRKADGSETTIRNLRTINSMSTVRSCLA
jgi:phage head maturation protease